MAAKSFAVLFFSGVAVGCGAAKAHAQEPDLTEFLGSMCVNVHLSQGQSPAAVAAMLSASGLRCIRDSDNHGDAMPYLTVAEQVPGLQVDMFTGDINNGLQTGGALADAGILLALEGPNEPNNFRLTYNGQSCAGRDATDWTCVAEFQRDWYDMVNADSQLTGYPMWNVSEVGAEPNNVGLQCNAPGVNGQCPGSGFQGAVFADFTNDHNYAQGNGRPFQDNFAWIAADPQTATPGLDVWYNEHIVTWAHRFPGYTLADARDIPKVTTETGWASNPLCRNSVPETEQAAIYLDIYLAQFTRGWSHTAIYQLQDGTGGDTCDFGLFRRDGLAKLAGIWLGNMLNILVNETGEPTADLGFTTSPAIATVHGQAFQPGIIIVWDERASASDTVTVWFSVPHSYNLYDPSVDTAPISSAPSAPSVTLTLSNHPQILQLLD
jgi:hypothetical protein